MLIWLPITIRVFRQVGRKGKSVYYQIWFLFL